MNKKNIKRKLIGTVHWKGTTLGCLKSIKGQNDNSKKKM